MTLKINPWQKRIFQQVFISKRKVSKDFSTVLDTIIVHSGSFVLRQVQTTNSYTILLATGNFRGKFDTICEIFHRYQSVFSCSCLTVSQIVSKKVKTKTTSTVIKIIWRLITKVHQFPYFFIWPRIVAFLHVASCFFAGFRCYKECFWVC